MSISLQEVADSLNFTSKKSKTDKAVYGEVKAINPDKTYQVSLNGSDTTVKCARLSGAKVGDTVLVEILSNGYAVVTGTVGGDTDASDAQQSAAAAQAAAGDAQTAASAAQEAAEDAETAASQAVTDAAAAQTAAATADQKATAAGTAAAAAQTSADNAATAAATADSKADAASAAATRAETKADTASAAASRAETAAGNAETSAANAQSSADSALVGLSTVQDVVGVLNWITAHGTMTSQSGGTFDPAQVYFVVDQNGDYEVAGTRYAIVPEPVAEDIDSYYVLSVDKSIQNYVATHIAVDSEGLWLIPEGNSTPAGSSKKILIAVGGQGHTYSEAGTYILEKVNNVDTILAQFTTNGAVMNTRDASGRLYHIATLGYGLGNSGSGTLVRPYYTFGIRKANTAVGNYSVAEGDGCEASASRSHAEGQDTIASGQQTHAEGWGSNATGNSAHAEGRYTIASGDDSHAEGYTTEASGDESHAEGKETVASGDYSHAQGVETIAAKDFQTAIGRHNIEDTETATSRQKAFIIGNGDGITRSNAFDVAWNGETRLAIPYYEGSSVTGGSTITKQVTCSGYTLSEGNIIAVTFTSANAGSVSLNVNGTGSKYAYYNGSRLTASNGEWASGETVLFLYDGTYYQKIDGATVGTTYSSTDADLVYSLNSLGWTSAVIE